MSFFPVNFMDCVVAIGTEDEQGDVDWVASGFLYGHRAPASLADHAGYVVYLVSNRHVFEGQKSMVVRCNPRRLEPAREYSALLQDGNGQPLWTAHANPRIDVAVVPIDFNLLRRGAMQVSFFACDRHAARVKRLQEMGVSEGDFAYVLGFPMGLVGGRRNSVIVRSGAIARMVDVLARTHREFLLDIFVFPGNSGGPVLLKPEVSEGTAWLIGIVKSYVSYQDVAVSVQTQRPRVIFEENTGLASAHPIDSVEQTVKLHLRGLETKGRKKIRKARPKHRTAGRR